MLRIIHKAETPNLETNHKSFSGISRISRLANKHNGARLVLDMRKTFKADGNLASVYSAVNFNLNKSRNILTIFPRKACSLKVSHQRDMFGYFSRWEGELESTFQSGGTKVFAFEPYDYEKFDDYLLHDAFRKDWKGILPYHYKLDVKSYLRKLFQNASEHSNANSPIFISSCYDGRMLKFTIVDCGEGFLKKVQDGSESLCKESNAISWAMNGNSVKGEERSETLKSLGQYCTDNKGELLVISGGATVMYCNEGFHKDELLPGPFRGSIVNLSIEINLPDFMERCAA